MSHSVSPSATGPTGPRFEVQVGAHYLLTMLVPTEPRGLSNTVMQSVSFQQIANGRLFDDIVIMALNADGTPAVLEIQAKRTMDFTRSDTEFADITRRLWEASQKPEFTGGRYELAVAIARTSTKIERCYQDVLHWARQRVSGDSFIRDIERQGYASQGMRDFVNAFRHHLAASGGNVDNDVVWRLLRRFQILVFDFESQGSRDDYFARERARLVLRQDQRNRAADLWSILIDKAQACDAAGGEIDRTSLINMLRESHGLFLDGRTDLNHVRNKLSETARLTLADIKDSVGGMRLARPAMVEQSLQALDSSQILEITGEPGVGKSALLKDLVTRLALEGTVIVLSPSRIAGGGWVNMANIINCQVSRDELMNELGASGSATLFIDNIDQIDNEEKKATAHDLLRGVAANPAWRAVVTIRAGGHDWHTALAAEFRQLSRTSIRVGEISDEESDVLRTGNPTLAALLSPNHPARAIARNLFHLSRLVELVGMQTEDVPATEIDLARLWWRYGGGRSEQGRGNRLRALRALATRVIQNPGAATYHVDDLDAGTIDELINADTLREDAPGSTAAFRHDVLRDWAIGFFLDENPEGINTLPFTQPLPGALARGVETASRLALEHDTATRWETLIATINQNHVHGSWRRPILLALPHSENAWPLFERVDSVLLQENGRVLGEIIRLVIAIDSEPLAKAIARFPQVPVGSIDIPATLAMPTTPSWSRLISWIMPNITRLPNALIPDLARFFELWLFATNFAIGNQQVSAINGLIIGQLYLWLIEIERARYPDSIRELRSPFGIRLDSDQERELHEQVRITFLAFCNHVPALAEQYFREMGEKRLRHKAVEEIMRFPGSAVRAAPAALVDLIIKALIPEEEPDRHKGFGRDLYRRMKPLGLYDTLFYPAAARQGPFLELLNHAQSDGFRLIRTLVEYATRLRCEDYEAEDVSFPSITISFPNGMKTFKGDFPIYQWTRGDTGSSVIASALMALEVWGHKQIEAGRPFNEVLHDVLGEDGASLAFLAIAVDLVLSHWQIAKEYAWPLLASPELLRCDQDRFIRENTQIRGLFLSQSEENKWRAKMEGLLERPSRRMQLLDQLGHYAVYGPAEIRTWLRDQLMRARERIGQRTPPAESDPVHGLYAMAERALRRCDAANWKEVRRETTDGQEIIGFQYYPPPEELAILNPAQEAANADIAELNIRLRLQQALSDPGKSSPELVAEGIQWARSAPVPRNRPSRDEEHDAEWRERAVIIAAALAARDYEGQDRADIENWSISVLEQAATAQSDFSARVAMHVDSNPAAIAAIGFVALYRRRRDAHTLNMLFELAIRDDTAIIPAIANHFKEFMNFDNRLVRSFVRIILASSIRPWTTHDETKDRKADQQYGKRVKAAIKSEQQWLGNAGIEPAWPELPLWPSRRKKGIRLPSLQGEDIPELRPPQKRPDVYVAQQTIANLFGYIKPLVRVPAEEWITELACHMLDWTISANNGADEDEDGDRENLPLEWNISFFDFLGFLCAQLPFNAAKDAILVPITQLHDDAFHDVMASFLMGFDGGIPEREDCVTQPSKVRALYTERLKKGRHWNYYARKKSFTAEYRLGHALCAMYFHTPSWGGQSRCYLPANYERLGDYMPELTDLAVSAPASGYIVGLFLSLLETCPAVTLIEYAVKAAESWAGAYGIDADFWAEKRVGSRLCTWISGALVNNPEWRMNASTHETLVRCLDTMIRSGVTQARELETNIMAVASRS